MKETWQGVLKLRNLTLTNFRQFRQLHIDFDERLTVFIGENGSGKTTVLDAITKSLELFDRRSQTPLDVNIDVSDFVSISDINNQTKDFTKIELITEWSVKDAEINQEMLDSIATKIEVEEDFYNDEIEHIKKDREESLKSFETEELPNYTEHIKEKLQSENNLTGKPLNIATNQEITNFANYRRYQIEKDFNEKEVTLKEKLDKEIQRIQSQLTFLEASTRVEFMLSPTLVDALYSGENETGFSSLDEVAAIASEIDKNRRNRDTYRGHSLLAYYPCFSLTTYAENTTPIVNGKSKLSQFTFNTLSKGRPGNVQELSEWFRDEQGIAGQKGDFSVLEIVQEAVFGLLNDDPEQPIYSDLFYDYSTKELTLKKNNVDVRLSQFSSGEKMLFLLVVDLAKRLIAQHPKLEAPLKTGTGIVLIDEIDLHLHPKWQRKVIPQLMKTFEQVQFVVTTHSAIVLQGVQRENIRRIVNGIISDEIPYVYGRDINSIQEDAFGFSVLPKEFEEKIEEISRLIDDEDEEGAKAKLNELKKLWGQDDLNVQRLALHTELI